LPDPAGCGLTCGNGAVLALTLPWEQIWEQCCDAVTASEVVTVMINRQRVDLGIRGRIRDLTTPADPKLLTVAICPVWTGPKWSTLRVPRFQSADLVAGCGIVRVACSGARLPGSSKRTSALLLDPIGQPAMHLLAKRQR
jgi:hypothetical protein